MKILREAIKFGETNVCILAPERYFQTFRTYSQTVVHSYHCPRLIRLSANENLIQNKVFLAFTSRWHGSTTTKHSRALIKSCDPLTSDENCIIRSPTVYLRQYFSILQSLYSCVLKIYQKEGNINFI